MGQSKEGRVKQSGRSKITIPIRYHIHHLKKEKKEKKKKSFISLYFFIFLGDEIRNHSLVDII